MKVTFSAFADKIARDLIQYFPAMPIHLASLISKDISRMVFRTRLLIPEVPHTAKVPSDEAFSAAVDFGDFLSGYRPFDLKEPLEQELIEE